MTASGEMPLRVRPDPAGLPGGKHHGAGEVNTLVDLYRHHQQRIYRYCLALLRNPDDAEDATQETFTRAAPFLPNLPGDLSAYLTTVARNICCDVVRARSRRVVPIDNVPLADRAVSPERQSVDWDVVRRMWRQLTPSERLLFAYTFAGYKYEEIATRTGMSRPSVSVGLARARRRIRDLAAATGTLALLPAALRRLVERISRRATSALASAQGTVLGLTDQVGTVAVSLLTGLLAAGTTATVASPAMMPAAQKVPDLGARPSTGQVERAGASAAGGAAPVARAAKPGQPSSPGSGSAPLPPVVASAAAVLPGASAAPRDMMVSGVAASPSYPSDHTVFVWGEVVYQGVCFAPYQCIELFRSGDGGASWTPLGAGPYNGGNILLPPTYPRDPALFSIGASNGLWESSTGNGVFTPVLPNATAAAVAPDSAPGSARIATVVSYSGVVLYNAGTMLTSPPIPLPPGFTGTAIAFSTPGSVVVSGYVTTGPSTTVMEAVTCTFGGTCSVPTAFSGADKFYLSASPNVLTDHLVAAYSGTTLYLSRDGGATFAAAWTTSSQTIFAATLGLGPSGPRLVLGLSDRATGQRESVEVSDDLGQSFRSITGDLDATSVLLYVQPFQDGTYLAGLNTDTTGHFALRQSTGNGIWTKPS